MFHLEEVSIRKLSSNVCSLGIIFALSSPALSFEGNYTGSLSLQHPGIAPVSIPLELSLSLSAETRVDDDEFIFDRKHSIDALLIVDSESGPFRMSDAQFFLSTHTLKILYRRGDSPAGRPANLILEGQLGEDGVYRGEAIGGVEGRLGQFTLSPSDAVFKTKKKYLGAWSGPAIFDDTGEERNIDFKLEDGGGQTTNPPNFDLEYTPTKLAVVRSQSIPVVFHKTHINYLTGEILCVFEGAATSSGTISLLAHFDPISMDLVGAQYSNLKGRVMTFRLEKKR